MAHTSLSLGQIMPGRGKAPYTYSDIWNLFLFPDSAFSVLASSSDSPFLWGGRDKSSSCRLTFCQLNKLRGERGAPLLRAPEHQLGLTAWVECLTQSQSLAPGVGADRWAWVTCPQGTHIFNSVA